MAFVPTVKSPDSPSERHSPYPPGAAEPGPGRSDERTDRDYDYDRELTSARRRSAGGRNLLLGVILVGSAVAVFLKALMLTGAKAGPPLAAALATLLVLFVLARTRLLLQRNGGFVALGVVILVAALVPLAEYALTRVPLPEQPATTAAANPSAPAPQAKQPAEEPELPSLTTSFQIPAPNDQGAHAVVLRDLRVEMGDGKAYVIKSGEVLPVVGTAPGEVHFLAGDQKIALPADSVEVTGGAAPAANVPTTAANNAVPGAMPGPGAEQPDTPARITERAQKEAIRRYPALGEKDSAENKLFVETFQELKQSGAKDFFADPEWPLQLAELLAKREKWQRQP